MRFPIKIGYSFDKPNVVEFRDVQDIFGGYNTPSYPVAHYIG